MKASVNILEACVPASDQDGDERSPVGVMQVVDSLAIGGAERVAVNLANLLPRDLYTVYLCTTREDGPLASLVAPHVGRLQLGRRNTLDLSALRSAISFIKARRIRLLHAHGTSVFFARVAGLLSSTPVIWHDHYGRCELNDRPLWPYRLAVRNIAAVITVNQMLADWSRRVLHVPSGRVRYIPNLVDFPQASKCSAALPGHADTRIACVANFREQKDHATLLRAMAIVAKSIPSAHLFLIGDSHDRGYRDRILGLISDLGLSNNVSYLGSREDVPEILRASAIGVLSSISEGLPLALLEYGAAGLPAVVTDVGQCADVLDNGACGVLVPPSNPEKLGEALLQLLASPSMRSSMGERFQKRVHAKFSADPIIEQIRTIYERVLQPVEHVSNFKIQRKQAAELPE